MTTQCSSPKFSKFYQTRTLVTEPSQSMCYMKQNTPIYSAIKTPSSPQNILRNFYNRTQICKCHANQNTNYTKSFQQSFSQQPRKEYKMDDTQRIRVLIQQNSNLKEQNLYLQNQLKKTKANENDLTETLFQYQNIMSVLNSQNSQLHRQILQLTKNANNKVNQLKVTVNNLVKKARKKFQREEKKQQSIYQNQLSFIQQQRQNERAYRRNNIKRNRIQESSKNESYLQQKSIFKGYQDTESKSSQLNIDGSCPFEEMLNQCRRQPDPKKRKLMRKKLAQYTYKRASSQI